MKKFSLGKFLNKVAIKIQGHSYKVVIEDKLLNSRGNLDAPIKPNSHKGDEVDPNYIRR